MKPASLRRQVSAGGVLYRKNSEGFDVVLVSVRDGRFWCLPKGLVDGSETNEETALREVREESGLHGRIVDTLGQITYWYYVPEENAKCRKTVHFFLMEYVSGNTEDHDSEVDDAVWFPVDQALSMISFKGDRRILEDAKTKLAGMHA